MNKTDEYESWILEAKDDFAKYIPNSRKIIDGIIIVVCSAEDITKEAKNICRKLDVYFPEDSNRFESSYGFAIHENNKYGIVLNDWENDIDDIFFFTLWHELAHCYEKEFDNVSVKLENLFTYKEKARKDNTYLLYGFEFWKEFEADSVAYLLLKKTGRYGDYLDEEHPSLEMMIHECIEHIDTQNQADDFLYKYFSFAFAEIRERLGGKSSNSTVEIEMFKNIILKESGDDSLAKEIKDSLIDMFGLLSLQMNKPEFWATNKNYIDKLGAKRIQFLDALEHAQMK